MLKPYTYEYNYCEQCTKCTLAAGSYRLYQYAESEHSPVKKRENHHHSEKPENDTYDQDGNLLSEQSKEVFTRKLMIPKKVPISPIII
jgi:hypothetical protein